MKRIKSFRFLGCPYSEHQMEGTSMEIQYVDDSWEIVMDPTNQQLDEIIDQFLDQYGKGSSF